jgi:hypothetical protein
MRGVAARRFRVATPLTATHLGVVVPALAVASLLLAALLGSPVPLAGLIALPVSIGVGILRYRLYEIDRIISRTLAYALVTGLLVGVYAGLVLLATQVLAVSSPVAVAASTLVAAALFMPLRRRVQHAVDRRFNRTRYDADRMVAQFAARLQGFGGPGLGPGRSGHRGPAGPGARAHLSLGQSGRTARASR